MCICDRPLGNSYVCDRITPKETFVNVTDTPQEDALVYGTDRHQGKVRKCERQPTRKIGVCGKKDPKETLGFVRDKTLRKHWCI